jgi:hypothetical protein
MNNLGDPNGCVCMSMPIAFAVLRFIVNSRFEAYREPFPHPAPLPVGLWERGPTKSAGKSPLATTARRDSCGSGSALVVGAGRAAETTSNKQSETPLRRAGTDIAGGK